MSPYRCPSLTRAIEKFTVINNSNSVAGVEGSLTSFTLYGSSLENERVVIAVMFPMPASKTNFSNFAPSTVDEKENRNQPVSQLASLKFTAVSAQADGKSAKLNPETIQNSWGVACLLLS